MTNEIINPLTGDTNSERQSRFLIPASLLAAGVTLSIVFAVYPEITPLRTISRDYGIPVAIGKLTAQFVLLLFIGFLLLRLLKHPARKTRYAVGGSLVAGTMFVFSTQIILVAGEAYQLPITLEAEAEAANYEDYVLHGDTESKTVFLSGTIGGGILDKLYEFERQYGTILHLEISSYGGLIDEAFAIADFLQQRDITVTTRGYCASACIIVALASKSSWAERGTEFGFHSVYPIVEQNSQLIEYSTKIGKNQVRDYMRRHSVPPDFVESAIGIPEDELIYQSAETLLKWGAIDKLVDRISREE